MRTAVYEESECFCFVICFFSLIPLREARQCVCSSVCFALIIINSKVVTREFLRPADLSGAQTLCIYEPTEVVIVGKYQDFVLAAFQIVTPGLKSLNNC